ncbi:MAG: hypothetical protein IJR82_04350 [Bacilli bacterium]|nr:hypothetical protein [Bacilli bacterium]
MKYDKKKTLLVISFIVIAISSVVTVYLVFNRELTASEYLRKKATNKDGLLYNDSSADKSKMFIFKHNGITETRYIGNVPNNYVEFNCDEDGTNCEIWRIIGVFEVQTPNKNKSKMITENRVKIVKDGVLPNKMVWDKKGNDNRIYNNWSTSSLKGFLNNEYYNRLDMADDYGLKDSARQMIDEVNYHLGGLDNISPYTTTEDIYNSEMGTKVYPKHPTEWISKVGVMYASDGYMVYGKGVNDECYNEPFSNCSIVSATAGWIYNSNNIDEQSDTAAIWFIDVYSNDEKNVTVLNEGQLLSADCNAKAFVRPVVYLSSKVKIIDGDGTKNNPYKLSI